uniref:ELMO domain-containing protein n=1 Tax=Toxocara canis TaxID=6265 RepID=A0A183TVT6_TOXCA
LLKLDMTEQIDISWAKDREKALEEWDETNKVSLVSDVGSVGDTQPPTSFQSIWTKLTAEDLAEEKACASEMILKEECASRHASSSRVPYCICRSGRPTKLALRNAALIEERLTIVALTKVKYSESNPTHWEMLVSIYKQIIDDRNSRTEVKRFGNHWETIGFQGDDPATDLRGVGIFGLCQLLFLVSNGLSSQMTSQLRDLSNDKVQSFPLAVVGLTWTQIIVERLKKGKLNGLGTKENSFISVVNGIYRGCFLAFYSVWRARQCTIADFCKISEGIQTIIGI